MSILSTEFNKMQSHVTCLNIAADFTDRADEERALSRTLADKVNSVGQMTIFILGLILAASAVGSIVLSQMSAVAIASVIKPVMLNTFIGMGIISSLAIPLIIYNAHQRSVHLNLARSYEHYALSANARAAEIPAWKNYGLIMRLGGALFSTGNSVTRYGGKTIAGQSTSTHSSLFWSRD